MAEVLDEQGMKSYTFYKIRRDRVSCFFKKNHTRMDLGGLVVRRGECSAREGSHPLAQLLLLCLAFVTQNCMVPVTTERVKMHPNVVQK